MSLQEIYTAAKLSAGEVESMKGYVTGEVEEFWACPAYEKLFEYFAFESIEMPYGVAKARTGDPNEWILDYLAPFYGVNYA